MFTGLIIEAGTVHSLEMQGAAGVLAVKCAELYKDAVLGDSIAVNGVCLTVTSIKKDILSFDVSFVTLQNTNLGSLRRGEIVNLEPSLRLNGKLGGHFVTGHVEAVGTISSVVKTGNAITIEIEAPVTLLQFLIPKGSVAVDGISLTVVDVKTASFTIVIIPHTASLTTIGRKKTGDTVNLESDLLAKYVAKFLQALPTDKSDSKSDATLMNALRKSGFL
jgi:riboflavin synthase